MNLSSIQTISGLFTIAPFDHRGSLAQSFGLDPQAPATGEVLTKLKVLFMEAFSPLCSGVLVDPVYGFPAIAKKAKNTGLILTLESSGYTDDKTIVPTLIPDWSVHHVSQNYAVAKLLVYYHPLEKNAQQKKKLIIELYQSCKYEDVAFLVEPVIYNPAGKEELTKTEFQEAQLTTAQDFQKYCDVLKLQYPGDALACATLTASLDIPWIILSRGMDFPQFKEALRISMENGAKGFAAGRTIWQEIGAMKTADNQPDLAAIQQFLQTTGKQRLQELISITETPSAFKTMSAQ
jgi:tagatose 1,6-diphosphate aldolase